MQRSASSDFWLRRHSLGGAWQRRGRSQDQAYAESKRRMKASVYQPSQAGAGTMRASEIAITISATSIWNPALQHAHLSNPTCACSGAQQHCIRAVGQFCAFFKATISVNQPCSAQYRRVNHLCLKHADCSSLTAWQQTAIRDNVCLDSQHAYLLFTGAARCC